MSYFAAPGASNPEDLDFAFIWVKVFRDHRKRYPNERLERMPSMFSVFCVHFSFQCVLFPMFGTPLSICFGFGLDFPSTFRIKAYDFFVF